jgi:hypothetical protein
VVLVSCARAVVDGAGRPFCTRGPQHDGRVSGLEAVRRTVRSGTNLFGEPGAVLLRASALGRAGRFDGSLPYVIDVDLWCRVLLYGDLYQLAEALCTFRVSPASLSATLRGQHSKQFRAFVHKLRRQPRYGIGVLDAELGAARSVFNEAARLGVFYLLGLRALGMSGRQAGARPVPAPEAIA